jgi:hypothetical protein
MDISEFEKIMPPSGKRSKLSPFTRDIMSLKSKGYADWQIVEFLKLNGVTISREGVRSFIKRQQAITHPAASSNSTPSNNHQEKLLETLKKKRQEAEKHTFQHDPSGKHVNLKGPGTE